MFYTAESLEKLAGEFAKLPGIGKKTAHRLALYISKASREEVESLAKALIAVKDKIR